jgi:hypothetical protein
VDGCLFENVYISKDQSLRARVDSVVDFNKEGDDKSYVSILPFEAEVELISLTQSLQKRGSLSVKWIMLTVWLFIETTGDYSCMQMFSRTGG